MKIHCKLNFIKINFEVLEVKSLILYFFLIMLKIILNLSPDTSYKHSKFLKTLLKKSFKFALSKKDNIITFNLSFELLLAEVNSISKKQNCEKNALIVYNFGYVKMILILLTKIVILYRQAFITLIEVLNLKNFILESKVCLLMFLAFNKQF